MFRKTMEEYEADTRKKLVIDIREKEAFDKETMPGALHMDSETLKQQIKELTKDQTPVYLLCHTGQQSDALAEDFEKEGYEVYSIQDGFRAYLRLKLRLSLIHILSICEEESFHTGVSERSVPI